MKKMYLSILCLFLGISLFANPVSVDQAREIATQCFKHYADKNTEISIAATLIQSRNDIPVSYIFIFETKGFVIVAADDVSIPILGYSTESTLDPQNIPANMQYWINQYNDEIARLITAGADNKPSLTEWNNIRSGAFNDSKLVVTPLLSTTWDQGCYYNALCPADGGGDCSHTYTGCVATTMAQIMKYWAYPVTGAGTYTYTDATYGTQTANFGGTTYNWGSMPNNVSSANTAVATIMYHAGVSVDMSYSVDGSGAYSWDVPGALINYFTYQNTAEIKFKADFTTTNWNNMLKAELDASRPVYYSGDNGSAGHAFVCDGYNASSQFHFNWGWSGFGDGYFTMGALNPIGSNFSSNNMAVIRIKPPSAAPVADFIANTTTPAVAGTVTYTDYSSNSPTAWSWAFEGGTPATSTLQTPPSVSYATAGVYQVSLTVTNASGTDTKIKTQYINVGGTPSAWIKQNTGFSTASRGIDQICIVNPFVVWAKAYDGVTPTSYIREFTRTTNGGITWTPGTITFTNSTSYGVSNIYAINDTVAYACMFPTAGTGGKIVKTTNGGTTWTEQATATFTSSWANFVHFFNTTDGVAMGDPTASGADFVIYTTTNGGTTWTQINAANIPNCSGTEAGIVNFYDVVGNTIWFGTSIGRIYKSTDKGLNWTVVQTNVGANQSYPTFKDANTGLMILAADPYTIKKTTDGGATWNTITPTGFYLEYPHIDYVPGTAAMWVDVSSGPGTGSSYSMDDCATFLDIDTGSVQYTTVKFYDIHTAWAGGFNVSASDGGIYKWNFVDVTGQNEPLLPSGNVNVYPNPTNGFVNIEFTDFIQQSLEISVYNLIGEKIQDRTFNTGSGNTVQLDLSAQPAGIYMINIYDGTTRITKRISMVR